LLGYKVIASYGFDQPTTDAVDKQSSIFLGFILTMTIILDTSD
jgi:hypothetical protein